MIYLVEVVGLLEEVLPEFFEFSGVRRRLGAKAALPTPYREGALVI